MSDYDNTNSGMLQRNERKTEAKHPDFSGQINVEGVDYWLSGWLKEGRQGGKMAGKKFFSLAIKRKDAPKVSCTPPRAPAGGGNDEDVPF